MQTPTPHRRTSEWTPEQEAISAERDARMQTPIAPLPMDPENEEIAAELRYLDSIADKTATVRSYSDGELAGTELYLETAWGDQLVTGIRHFSDGPWIVTGSGYLNQRSFAVCWDTKLKVGRAS